MPRIRSIKPEFWGDEDMASELSRDERLLYVALWNFCHDNWTMEYKPRTIKVNVFPFDDDLTPEVIERMVEHIAETGRIVFFEHEGRPCLWLPKCSEHQKVNRPKDSPIPTPSTCGNTPFTERSVNHHGTVTDESVQGKDRDRIGKERSGGARERSVNPPRCLSDAENDGLLMSMPGTDMAPPWTHILRAIERKRKSAVSHADIAIIAGAIDECCPTCSERNPTRCAAEVIGRIERAASLTTAARFIRADMKGA